MPLANTVQYRVHAGDNLSYSLIPNLDLRTRLKVSDRLTILWILEYIWIDRFTLSSAAVFW